jgi:hypothetical protein
MDPATIHLLSLTPGIIRRQSGIIRQTIDPSDWVKMLTMQDPMTVVNEGQWIQVRKGKYKGDFGFVMRMEAKGAQVLLIPRLEAPTPKAATSLKRKRATIRPEPRLFDPDTFRSLFQRDPICQDDGTYTFDGLVFDHGLLLRDFNHHSLSPIFTRIPTNILFLFQLSAHPTVIASDFPCPKEWIFAEGEQIVILSLNKKATITAVQTTHLEVDLATEEGIEAVSWHDVRKDFNVGDFVSVMGTMGWVDLVDDDIAYIIEHQEKNNISTFGNGIKVNFIQVPADLY